MKPFASIAAFVRTALIFFVFIASGFVHQAQASGGGGPSGPEPLKFTVNLQEANGDNKYLQIEVVFETAKPEAGQALASLKPRVQHAMILLLSGQDSGRLRTREGKHHLIGEIIEAVNKVIEETEKTGVNEVLFTSFIIQ
jgi:flagellar protein FliL